MSVVVEILIVMWCISSKYTCIGKIHLCYAHIQGHNSNIFAISDTYFWLCICKESRHFVVEFLQTHSSTVLSFQPAMGGLLWHAVFWYLTPHNASILAHVVSSIRQLPWGAELLVSGYFNVDLVYLEGHNWYKTIAATMAT